MTIDIEVRNKTTVILRPSGRLDTTNATLLEQKLRQWGDEITELVLNFEDLDYISSMGLRVLLAAQKSAKEKKRQFVIKNLREPVREVFELTGFINLVVREEGFVLLRRDEAEGIILFFNGELTPDNIPTVSDELGKIRKRGILVDYPVTVIMDMKKLCRVVPPAFKMLRQVVANTEWKNRKILVRNVPPDYLKEIGTGGLGELVQET